MRRWCMNWRGNSSLPFLEFLHYLIAYESGIPVATIRFKTLQDYELWYTSDNNRVRISWSDFNAALSFQ